MERWGGTAERGVASPAQPSLIHSVWVSPVTLALWVWWMWHICPPEPPRLGLGGPLCMEVMATVLHHWHIITHTSKLSIFVIPHAGFWLIYTCEDKQCVRSQTLKTYICRCGWRTVAAFCSYNSIHPPPFSRISTFDVLPIPCAASCPLIFFLVAINIFVHVLHQCSVINVSAAYTSLIRLRLSRMRSSLVHNCTLVFETCTIAQFATKQACLGFISISPCLKEKGGASVRSYEGCQET